LGAFIALFEVTAQVIEGDLLLSSQPGVWVALWLLTGLVTIALWLATALPPRTWWPLARASAWPLLVGTAVAVTAGAAGWLTREAWRPLGQLTFWAVERLITLGGADPITDSTRMLVGTHQFSVTIAPQCSGYEGIGLLWVFLAAYLWLFRRSLRFPQVLLLFPAGTLLMWLLNAARIAALIGVGTWLSPSIAVGGFHSYSGLLLFCGATLGLVAATQHSRFFRVQDGPQAAGEVTNPTAVYLAPLVTLVAVTMMAGAFSAGGFDALYPLRVVAVGAALWLYRRERRALRWTGSWVAVTAGIAVFALWIALESTRTGFESGAALEAGLVQLPTRVAGMWLLFRVVGSVVGHRPEPEGTHRFC
jgi:exosortase E/protease (VPEID-CTERM system)